MALGPSTSPPPRPRSKAAPKRPALTSAKRRDLLESRLEGISAWVDRRGDMALELGDEKSAAIDKGTAFILRLNADDLVAAYSQAADHSPTFARGLDSALTGGIWGQFVAVNLATLTAVGLIRGWIKPEQLPAPIRALMPQSMFGPPPPSEEVQKAEEQARATAPGNGQATRPQPRPEEPPSTAPGKHEPKPAEGE